MLSEFRNEVFNANREVRVKSLRVTSSRSKYPTKKKVFTFTALSPVPHWKSHCKKVDQAEKRTASHCHKFSQWYILFDLLGTRFVQDHRMCNEKF